MGAWRQQIRNGGAEIAIKQRQDLLRNRKDRADSVHGPLDAREVA